MKKILSIAICAFAAFSALAQVQQIPLPEHPRPDFERSQWVNLNGQWSFTFSDKAGVEAVAKGSLAGFDKQITVPFGWGSPLSGVANEADSAWYGRQIVVPQQWSGKRVFVVIGASDHDTEVYLDGHLVAEHRGGYTPFEAEITQYARPGEKHLLLVKAEDITDSSRLYGKQGYGNVRGIWQTVYLEARGPKFIEHVHFSPDIDASSVKVEVALSEPLAKGESISLSFKNGDSRDFVFKPKGKERSAATQVFTVNIDNQHLWDLDDPYLYEVSLAIADASGAAMDEVSTYFGQRKIGTMTVPGKNYKYIALNNKPIYMQMCLDQSYNADGFYTFPTDEFMRNEIQLCKDLGLNGDRVHIKVEVPRKLYWADKLGMLIMADVPNYWGEPTDAAKANWEYCMREQIKRDFNHPSIFAWVDFNETWGLWHKSEGFNDYRPETQKWVQQMYLLTKSIDPTRLVEDNSTNIKDHVQTDINSWHNYKPGYDWEEAIARFDANTYPGSPYNYAKGYFQDDAPMMNSECGNVWGYKGSSGDCDFTWDYHLMINSFRRHPRNAGWLYTEHHDVINEWNGYVRYDRSPKVDGLGELMPGMTMADFHSPYYIVADGEMCIDAPGGKDVNKFFEASFMTDKDPGPMRLVARVVGWDDLGDYIELEKQTFKVDFQPWYHGEVARINADIPDRKGVYVLQYQLETEAGKVLARNFNCIVVRDAEPFKADDARVVTFDPAAFSEAQWSYRQWNVLEGFKVNGTGNGFFEYAIPWPSDLKAADLSSVELRFEASAKQLFGKDMTKAMIESVDLDFMLGGGTNDPCANPNSYAMTDTKCFSSSVETLVNGVSCGTTVLPDDPADHRGILSWRSQRHSRTLHEAGSYGYLVKVNIPVEALHEGEPIVVRFAVPEGLKGGLALYGKSFGRYMMDPTIIFKKR